MRQRVVIPNRNFFYERAVAVVGHFVHRVARVRDRLSMTACQSLYDSERGVAVAETVMEVFGSPERAAHWLAAKSPALGHKNALSLY